MVFEPLEPVFAAGGCSFVVSVEMDGAEVYGGEGEDGVEVFA